jgi:hypothetical protein
MDQVDRSQTLTEFIKEDRVNLTRGVHYDLTDMAVTSDNKLLLCNFFDKKVYIYTMPPSVLTTTDHSFHYTISCN